MRSEAGPAARQFHAGVADVPAMGLTSDTRGTKELHLSPSDLSELIVSIGGVKFWIVSVAPLYIGWVLAQPGGLSDVFVGDLCVGVGLIVVGAMVGSLGI